MIDLKKAAADLKSGAKNARNTKSTRIWFMILLLAIIILLYVFGVIKKGFAIGLGILLLAAIGIETFNYDLDLGKLWKTGSLEESRVTHTKDGIVLYGSCALPKNGVGDLNCANFATQTEAQAKYDQCAHEISADNVGIDVSKIRSLDIYRLDGDKDGIVCESLPGAPKKEISTPLETEETKSKSTPTRSTNTQTTKKNPPPSENTFSTTPIPRVDEPYPITEKTIRTNPKTLPSE